MIFDADRDGEEQRHDGTYWCVPDYLEQCAAVSAAVPLPTIGAPAAPPAAVAAPGDDEAARRRALVDKAVSPTVDGLQLAAAVDLATLSMHDRRRLATAWDNVAATDSDLGVAAAQLLPKLVRALHPPEQTPPPHVSRLAAALDALGPDEIRLLLRAVSAPTRERLRS